MFVHTAIPDLLDTRSHDMKHTSLSLLVEEQLATARQATSGRAAVTIHGGHEHDLRQTVIALAEGRSLGEHESPGEATLQVLSGRVRLAAGPDTWEGAEGDHLVIPPARHDLTALTDTTVLLTVATRA
jgi:quercetin dioxygenase-like cupin family protein